MTNRVPPKKRGSWFARHKPIVLGGGAVVAVSGIVLYERAKSSSSTSAGSTAAGAGSTDTVSPSGTSTYTDTSGDYNSLESQVSQLQSQLSASQTSDQAALASDQSAIAKGNATDVNQYHILRQLGAKVNKKPPAKKAVKPKKAAPRKKA